MAAERGSSGGRDCPRCDRPCSVVERHEVQLDHCASCGGTFLESGEAPEIFGPYVSPSTWKQAKDTEHIRSGRYHCPADGHPFDTYRVGLTAERRLGRDQRESVEIDLCPSCAGMWFEPKEGKRLREIVMSAGQQKETHLSEFASSPGIGTYLFQLLSGLPIEVWNPRHRRPTLTLAMIGLLGGIFVLTLLASQPQQLVKTYAMIPADIQDGQRLWTLLTGSFLHGGWGHMLANAYFLYVFGANLEDALGAVRFAGLFVVAALAGSLLQVGLQGDPTVPVVGASDAVAGMMGAYLMLFPRVKVFQVILFIRFRLGILWYLGLWVGLNLLIAAMGTQHVAVWAHIGGFLAGIAAGWLYRVRPLVQELRPTS